MRWIVIALSIPLVACGPSTQAPSVSVGDAAAEARIQREMAFEAMLRDHVRLYGVAGQVMFGATSLCGNRVKPTSGVTFWSVYDHPGEMREIARKIAGLGDSPRVLFTVPGGPAHRAGLLPGDELTAVGATPILPGSDATKELTKLILAGGAQPYTLTIRRPPLYRVDITPVPACDFAVELKRQDQINASADGNKITVTTGMMRFAQNDEELAFIIAHELAHNATGHIGKKRGNVVAGSAAGFILDIFAAAVGVNTGGAFTNMGGKVAAGAFSKAFEAEADYVGLYMLAQSGLPIENAPNFWRRMAMIDPKSIEFARTHPTNPERFVQMSTVIEEIRAKVAAGQPLTPNLKTRTSSSPASSPMEVKQRGGY